LHELEADVPDGRALLVYRGWGRRAVPSRAAPRALLGELMRQLGPPPEGSFMPRGPEFEHGSRGAEFGEGPPRDGPPHDRPPFDGPDERRETARWSRHGAAARRRRGQRSRAAREARLP
jgi:hypothetical protein